MSKTLREIYRTIQEDISIPPNLKKGGFEGQTEYKGKTYRKLSDDEAKAHVDKDMADRRAKGFPSDANERAKRGETPPAPVVKDQSRVPQSKEPVKPVAKDQSRVPETKRIFPKQSGTAPMGTQLGMANRLAATGDAAKAKITQQTATARKIETDRAEKAAAPANSTKALAGWGKTTTPNMATRSTALRYADKAGKAPALDTTRDAELDKPGLRKSGVKKAFSGPHGLAKERQVDQNTKDAAKVAVPAAIGSAIGMPLVKHGIRAGIEAGKEIYNKFKQVRQATQQKKPDAKPQQQATQGQTSGSGSRAAAAGAKQQQSSGTLQSRIAAVRRQPGNTAQQAGAGTRSSTARTTGSSQSNASIGNAYRARLAQIRQQSRPVPGRSTTPQIAGASSGRFAGTLGAMRQTLSAVGKNVRPGMIPKAPVPAFNDKGGKGISQANAATKQHASPDTAAAAEKIKTTSSTSTVQPDYDKMNFKDAFAAARKRAAEEGAKSTGKFKWKGKEFQTNIKGKGTAKKPVEKYVAPTKQKPIAPKPITTTQTSVPGGQGVTAVNLSGNKQKTAAATTAAAPVPKPKLRPNTAAPAAPVPKPKLRPTATATSPANSPATAPVRPQPNANDTAAKPLLNIPKPSNNDSLKSIVDNAAKKKG